MGSGCDVVGDQGGAKIAGVSERGRSAGCVCGLLGSGGAWPAPFGPARCPGGGAGLGLSLLPEFSTFQFVSQNAV